jgi:very-short-patch-repair endonuclease
MIKYENDDEKRSTLAKRRNNLMKKMTPSEKLFADRLEESGIRYLFQKGFFIGDSFRIVDFYLPKPYKLAIEIDGDYHRNTKLYDEYKDTMLKDRGIKTIRILNENVSKFDIFNLAI